MQNFKTAPWFTNNSHGDFAFGTSPRFCYWQTLANFLREDVEKLGPSQLLEMPTIGIIIGTSENPFPLKAPSFAANNMEPEIQNPIPKHSMYGKLCIFDYIWVSGIEITIETNCEFGKSFHSTQDSPAA